MISASCCGQQATPAQAIPVVALRFLRVPPPRYHSQLLPLHLPPPTSPCAIASHSLLQSATFGGLHEGVRTPPGAAAPCQHYSALNHSPMHSTVSTSQPKVPSKPKGARHVGDTDEAYRKNHDGKRSFSHPGLLCELPYDIYKPWMDAKLCTSTGTCFVSHHHSDEYRQVSLQA